VITSAITTRRQTNLPLPNHAAAVVVHRIVMRRTVQDSRTVEVFEKFERLVMAKGLRYSWKCAECGETSRREPHWSLVEHMKTRHQKEWDKELGFVQIERLQTEEERVEALLHNFLSNQFTEE